jgi:hypothetical protein
VNDNVVSEEVVVIFSIFLKDVQAENIKFMLVTLGTFKCPNDLMHEQPVNIEVATVQFRRLIFLGNFLNDVAFVNIPVVSVNFEKSEISNSSSCRILLAI